MCEAMPELTERQKTLLILIIRHYIESARPVGSKQLAEDYRLPLSSATIRNEMAALTEMGYLRQPHTSAGRVPTEEGYRFFVSQMMNQAELSPSIQATISHQFYQFAQELSAGRFCKARSRSSSTGNTFLTMSPFMLI